MEIIENKTSTINNLEGLPLILVGTSETGHAMANFAYRLLIKQGFAHKYFPSATAVIGLGAVGSDLEVYGKDFSKNYLLISGSHDGEINVAESTYAYQYYDLLFGFKSLLFLKGANHAKYLEGDDVKNAYSDLVKLGQATQIQAKTQRLVVAQYVTMFSLMATHNGAYNDYRAVFKGDKIVNFTSVDQTINNDLTTLFRAAPLYSYKGGQFSLTITDNKITFVSLFQKDQLITPKQPAVLAPLKNLAPGVCFHSAMGYRVSWAIGWAINPSLVVEIAKEVQSGPEPKYFEFDAIQMPLSIFNSPTELDVQARLVYYGKMTKPVGFRIQPSFTPAPPPQGYSRAVLSTIRLAVSDFGVTIGTFKNVTNLIIELAVFRQTGEILFTPFRWA